LIQKVNIKNVIFPLDKVTVLVYDSRDANRKEGGKLIPNLRRIRKQNNLTQEQLANKSGISRISIVRYESGESEPNLSNITKLCKALSVTVSDLISEDEAEKEDAT